jgi:glycosyltransferase involved in cell wall biosynthesis
MNTDQLVSIVIPCYKMGKFIGEALESVGKQTYGDWEVIAVDDCGPEDGTQAIVESFGKSHTDHRVEFIRHEENKGVSAARNTAIRAADGHYLAFLDPDDYWGGSYLKTHIGKLEVANAISVSYTAGRCVSEQGALTGEIQGPDQGEWQNLPESLYRRNFINPSTVVVSKACVQSCGGFDESQDIQHIEDWDLWLRLMDEGVRFSYTPEAESYYRAHPGAATQNLEGSINRRVALWKKHFSKQQFKEYKLRHFAEMEFELKRVKGRLSLVEGEIAILRAKSIRSRLSKLISGALPASIERVLRKCVLKKP